MGRMPDIDRDASTAIYRQVAGAIRQRIEAGEWQPGQRLPGVIELMSDYGVARLTARKAMRLLVDEGTAEMSPGKGYYVAADYQAPLCSSRTRSPE